MNPAFRDREHLLRLLCLFAVGVVLFLGARAVLVPEGFGVLGHYRVGALADNAGRSVTFGGEATCLTCHEDGRTGGAHAGVRCEACHGPLAAHAADPSTVSASRPEPKTLCRVCHEQTVGRPRDFPQVRSEDHSGGASCADCHKPHAPGLA